MAVYKAGSPSLSPRQRKLRELSVFMLVIVEIFALFFVLFAFYRRDTASVAPVEGTAVSGGFYDPNPEQKTEDFTFKAPNNWSLDKRESPPGVYTYKAYNGSLVTQVLTIYVNQPMKESRVTYLQPVTVEGDKMILGELSEHCNTLTKKDGNVAYGGSTFNCWAENGQAFVGIGLVGGGSAIPLKTESGVTKNYSFRLVESRFSPSFNEFTVIMKSFRAK